MFLGGPVFYPLAVFPWHIELGGHPADDVPHGSSFQPAPFVPQQQDIMGGAVCADFDDHGL